VNIHIAPSFLNDQLHAPTALLAGKKAAILRKLGEPQSRCYTEEKHVLLLQRIEPRVLGHPARSLVSDLAILNKI
jgi:hypothetical protein